MKRKLAAAVLGIAASLTLVSSAHAQGRIFFASYNATTDAIVTYNNGSGSTPVNNTFTAGLWYFLGTTTLSVGNGIDSMPAGWELSPVTAQFSVAAPAGYFNGPIANISDYVSGPITFAVTAYNGATYGSTIGLRGHSAGFTLSSIATGQSGAGDFGPGFQSFAIIVPEPTVFSLAALGAAALLLIRRKK